jgi:hypothetical protein
VVRVQSLFSQNLWLHSPLFLVQEWMREGAERRQKCTSNSSPSLTETEYTYKDLLCDTYTSRITLFPYWDDWIWYLPLYGNMKSYSIALKCHISKRYILFRVIFEYQKTTCVILFAYWKALTNSAEIFHLLEFLHMLYLSSAENFPSLKTARKICTFGIGLRPFIVKS